jgi:predicted PurR-regulated permease PerM
MALVRGIFLPFVIGLAVAYLLDPLLDRMEARGWSRLRAVQLVFLALLGLVLVVASFVIPALVQDVQALVTNWDTYFGSLQVGFDHWQTQLAKIHLPAYLDDALDQIGEKARALGQRALSGTVSWLLGAVTLMLLLVVAPIAAYWFMREYDPLRRWLLLLVPDRYRGGVAQVAREVNGVLGSYLRGLITVCLVVGAIDTVALAAFGVQYWLLLGIIAGIAYAIPYVGVPGIMIVTGLVAVVAQHMPWPNVAIVLAIMAGVNFLADYLIMPRIVGQRVGLHPLIMIFALLAGAELWGVVGMIIAVPLAASVKVVLHHYFPDLFERKAVKAEGKAKAK